MVLLQKSATYNLHNHYFNHDIPEKFIPPGFITWSSQWCQQLVMRIQPPKIKLYLSASNVVWLDDISSNSETNCETNSATNFVAFQISEDGRRSTSDLEKCNFKMRLQSAVASWNTLQISASKLNILNSLAAAACYCKFKNLTFFVEFVQFSS